MKNNSAWIQEHQSRVFSQAGEDGIICKILEIIGENDKWCVEFGAMDGSAMSNTRNLIENHGYSAVLIEEDKKAYSKLHNRYVDNQKIFTINQLVGFQEKNNLGTILGNITIPCNFDFLSIDIDGNDYYVWKALSTYTPKLVCIEFNPTIPSELEFVQPADMEVTQGCSLLSLVSLAKEKGYELVCVHSVNAFFVQTKYLNLFEINDNSPGILWTDTSKVTYIFTGYDGTIFIKGYGKMPWHSKLNIKENKIQRLPKLLRKFPGNYSTIELVFYGLYLLLTEPKILFREIKRLRGKT